MVYVFIKCIWYERFGESYKIIDIHVDENDILEMLQTFADKNAVKVEARITIKGSHSKQMTAVASIRQNVSI